MNNQDSEKYETLYRELLKYSEETHERNKKRISAGIKCLIIIPVLLLILLFNLDYVRPDYYRSTDCD